MLVAYEKYRAAGFACVPTRNDKSPSVPKGTKLNGNWDNADDYKNAHGIGLWCGDTLECLDFDNKFGDAMEILVKYFDIPEVKEIYEKNDFAIQSTVSGGYHVIYKSSQVDGSDKLAMRVNGTGKPECLIETRGTGNYFCVDPTPGYKLLSKYGDILNLSVITPDERETLIAAARSFNEFTRVTHKPEEGTDRPGDIYNRSFEAIEDMKHTLVDHGWKELSEDVWQRPGKDRGISATLGKAADGIFYNFSANGDPFEMNKGYTAFQVVGLLKYNGDFKQFAKDLHEKQNPKTPPAAEPNKMELSRIDPLCELTEPPVYCSIGNSPTMTAGNFSLLNGKAKSGKTFFLGSIVASMLNNGNQLSVLKGSLPEDKQNILYFDTEQSTFHAARTIKRICSLISNPNPSNLIAYGLRPFTPAERLTFIEEKISKTPALGAVAIDGIRDLLTFGINDEAEATTLTSKFLKWTSDHNIHLILLLHQNKTDNNSRGHIGTECLNKAETTISISKDKSEIFIVSCEYSRDISFNDFGFTIDSNGMIQSSDVPQEGQTKGKNPKNMKDDEHFQKLDQIFKDSKTIGCKEFQESLIYHFEIGINRCSDFILHYQLKGWIKKEREWRKVNYTYQRSVF